MQILNVSKTSWSLGKMDIAQSINAQDFEHITFKIQMGTLSIAIHLTVEGSVSL